MNLNLIDLFDKASESPEFIPKLRQLILDLAVRGKLVPHDPKDEPASELLKKIKAEKDKLVKEGKIRPDKPLPPISQDEIPFEIPKNWEFTRFKTITHDWGQKIPDNDITYIDVSSIDNQKGIISSPKILSADEAPSRARKIVRKGTIIYSCVRPYLLNIAVIMEDYTPSPIASTAFAVLHPLTSGLNGRYLWLYLRSPLMINYVEGLMRGQAYPAINDRDFFQIPFPLPPLYEQKRIVEKVDELMTLCDELEAVHGMRDEKRERLNLASLKAVTDARTPEDFKNASHFFINNLTEITVTQDHIKNLRQTILDLAVRGKLVPQNPKDEPASELLKKIKAEKAKMIENKLFQKPSESGDINEDEFNYSLPRKWALAKAVDLGFVTKLAGFEYTEHIKLTNSGEVPVIRAQNVKMNYIDKVNLKYIDMETSLRLDRCALSKPCLLLTFIGAGIGDVATFNENKRWHLAPNVAKFEPFNNYAENLFIGYLQYYLMSGIGQSEIFKWIKSTAQPCLSMKTIRDIIFIIPPLTEQKRIVAKVDELMSLCDTLEKQISITSTQSTRLLNALLQEAI